MIGYALVGSRDLEKARPFFDAVFGELGYGRLLDHGEMTYWGAGFMSGTIGVCRPFDRAPATAGNGVMLALPAASRAQVDAVHARALAMGGADEGKPGVRGGEGAAAFYAAYFRDLDGNKFSVFRIGAA
jgi:catechol 2,3-dioxygenase-like lactoylglutathione lyase family enzyme